MNLILNIDAERIGTLTDEQGAEVGKVTSLSTEGDFLSLRAVLAIDPHSLAELPPPKSAAKAKE